MCIQIVERYSTCGCVYYRHGVDPCSAYGRHGVTEKIVMVGLTCTHHSSTSVHQGDRLLPRRGRVNWDNGDPTSKFLSVLPIADNSVAADSKTIEDDVDSAHESEQTDIFPCDEDTGRLVSTGQANKHDNSCPPVTGPLDPKHGAHSCDGREGDSQYAESVSCEDEVSSLRSADRIQLALLYIKRLLYFTQSSHSTLDQPLNQTMVLQRLQGAQNMESILESAMALTMTPHVDTGRAHAELTTPYRMIREHQNCLGVRPCYLLIMLGTLTLISSLVPALWQAEKHHDLAGGFTLAQYILGVGILIVGSVTAIHSRSCTCWQS